MHRCWTLGNSEKGGGGRFWRFLPCGRNLLFSTSVLAPPISCRYLWHSFRTAPQTYFPLSLHHVKKFHQSISTSCISNFTFLDMLDGRKSVSFSSAGPFPTPIPSAPTRISTCATILTWMDESQLSACKSRLFSRNMDCLFSYFHTVINWHPGWCKLAFSVQHNKHFKYQSVYWTYSNEETWCCHCSLNKEECLTFN